MSALYALVVLLNVLLAVASSVPPRPLARIAHPTTLALEILPRHNTLKRRSSTSPFLNSPTLFHSDSFRLTLSAFDETFHLHLRPNDHLIHPAARINYFKNGVIDRTVPLIRESVRAYWGEVVDAERSQQRLREDAAGVLPRPELGWARIVVHSQGDANRGVPPAFEGAFSVRGVTHHIQTRANYVRKRQSRDPDLLDSDSPDDQLVIWRDSDVVREEEQPLGCMHDDPWRSPVTHMAWDDSWAANVSLARRDDVQGSGSSSSNNFASNIGQTAGCPTTQRILYMGVAADCSYVAAHGSKENATAQIINNWNTASSLYKQTFNVSLGIVQIDVQDSECPSQAPDDTPWNVGCDDTSVTLNDRLSLFSDWRGAKGDDGAGLWHLMSGCPTGSEVGVAWLGTLCQQTTSGDAGSRVSGTAVSTNGRTEWEVVTHEIGHNFGAIHDCQDGCGSGGTVCCPLSATSCDANDDFIMSPVTSSSQKTFSACSLGNICSVMQSTSSSRVTTTCLVEPDASTKTISLNMCGNGIVESGEDCDPGQNTTSTCCDASTCKFANNAQCDPASSSCCTDSCTFAPASQVCRPSVDDKCDTAESCTGTSADCPADSFQPNGQSCGSLAGDNLACANGVCTSLSQQCRIVGASLNLTTACRNQDNSCRVSCEDPNSSLQCIQLQSQVIDGSPCGYGGTCQSGSCQAGSVIEAAKAWYVQNLQISIPVTVVVAIVAIALAWGLILCCKRTCKRKSANATEPALAGQRAARLNSWDGPPGARPPVVPVAPFATRPPAQPPMAARRVSVPPSLRPAIVETRNVPPSSMRNQSWDSAYGQPTAGSARAPSTARRENRGSGGSSTSRARQPAFPSLSGAQGRPRADRSNWVDPSKWNGPL